MSEFEITLSIWILFLVILILMIIYVLLVVFENSTTENKSLKSENIRLKQELNFEIRKSQKLQNKT